jgi:hypothetical protein
MAAQAVLPSLKSLRVLYQPFLGSSRAKQLTSLLSPHINCNFIPATDTSLSLVPSADIVLISRGGKPFAPVRQYISVDTTVRTDIHAQERKLSGGGSPYAKFVSRWEKAEKLVQKDINGETPFMILRRHFSPAEIDAVKFEERFRDLRRWEMVENVEALETAMKIWRKYKKAQEECMLFLGKTNGMAKYLAEKEFGLGRMKMREYVIEDHRDRLDLFRLELERRYKGMAMVKFPDETTRKPWILVPEDPIGAWGQDLQYRIGELVELAIHRFLSTNEEKEMYYKREADKYMETKGQKLHLANILEGDDPLDFKDTDGEVAEKELYEGVVDSVRAEKQRLFHQDEFSIGLPGKLGQLGEEFLEKPVTREDVAALQATDMELVELGSWRVDD